MNGKPEEKSGPSGGMKTPLAEDPRLFTAVYLVLLSVSVFVCYSTLLKYFFAQDDFILLHDSLRDGFGAVTHYFEREQGQFRPATKGLYFLLMGKFVGLNATVYHVISLLIHIANVGLMFMALRALGAGKHGSLVAATLFALSAAFFHVVAWIACIQQLLGMTFTLIAVATAARATTTGSRRLTWVSLGAYAAALACVEQPAALPIFLVAAGTWLPGARGFKDSIIRFAPHLGVMVLYGAFMLFWTKLPESGPYELTLGRNVLVNLYAYSAWAMHFFVVLPWRMQTDSFPFYASHIPLIVFIVYSVVRGRIRAAVLGTGFFVLMLAPTLGLSAHTFYLHTYVPSLGIMLLIALAVEDLFQLNFMKPRIQWAALAGILMITSVFGYMTIRKNETEKASDVSPWARSFVVRRAIIAKHAYDKIVLLKSPYASAITMIYYSPKGREEQHAWYVRNVMASLGGGSALSLIYGNPRLRVSYIIAGDPRPPADDTFIFNHHGEIELVQPPGSPRR